MSDDRLKTSDALKTYRYLRIGMISAVVLLATSVVLEGVGKGCWQTSISAYFYTPARSVVVGVLLAIGFALIVIKGRGGFEDTALNFAGMFAPIVALAPTSRPRGDDVCRPLSPAGDLKVAIDNNIWALLITGLVCLLAGLVIAVVLNRSIKAPFREVDDGTWKALLAAFVLVVAALVAKATWDDFNKLAHGWAARLMFVCMFGAAVAAAWKCNKPPPNSPLDPRARRVYGFLYITTAAGMFAMGALTLIADPFGRHEVLALEAIEIFWFGFFWAVQTAERWYEPPAGSPTVVAATP